MADRPPPLVPCPQCEAPTPFSPANRWRPFCSERCRSLDLGAWATESYRVAAKPNDQDAADDLADGDEPR